tara:strand:- start:880 stop:1722 length:843 start_codon:yes stop_codon:yes gene_type:complete
MENWRDFSDRDKLLENQEYITKVLGIKIPLNESYPYSSDLTEQILQEQLLLEGFFDDAVTAVKQAAQGLGDKARQAIQDGTAWVKKFGQNVGQLMHALWVIFRDPSKVSDYVEILDERMNIRRIGEMDGFVDSAVSMLANTPAAIIADKIKNLWTTTKEKYEAMASSWKKALVGSTMMVMLQYIFNKIASIMQNVRNLSDSGAEELTDQARETIGEELKNKVLSFFEETFGQIFTKLSSYVSGVGVWVEWLSKIVGGVDFVAKNLFGTTRGFLQKAQGEV